MSKKKDLEQIEFHKERIEILNNREQTGMTKTKIRAHEKEIRRLEKSVNLGVVGNIFKILYNIAVAIALIILVLVLF